MYLYMVWDAGIDNRKQFIGYFLGNSGDKLGLSSLFVLRVVLSAKKDSLRALKCPQHQSYIVKSTRKNMRITISTVTTLQNNGIRPKKGVFPN